MKINISIVIPLLNEAESLPELAQWIQQVMEQNSYTYEIIFIDDGSTDNSWQIIQQLAHQNSCIKALRFRRNYGKSAALYEGFATAQGTVVFTMDADLQDSPEEIPDMYNMIIIQDYDIVSGWKQKRYDPITKTIPTKLFNAATRKMSGIQLHDFNCGLKAYKSEVIKTIEVYGEMHRYIPVMAKWAGFKKIGEKSVQHRPRQYGVSKFGIERFINGFLDLLSIYFMGKFGKRPMHFFGLLGTLTFGIGFLIALWLSINKLFYEQYGIANRPLFFLGILCMIVGTQLFLAGFIGEMVARNSAVRNHYQIKETANIPNFVQKN